MQREEVDLVKDADTGKYFCSWTQLVHSSSEMRVALSPEEWKEAQELLEKAKEALTKLRKAPATVLCHGYTHNVDLSLQDASKYIDKVKGNKEDALYQQLLLI